jgi:hypothetical protein
VIFLGLVPLLFNYVGFELQNAPATADRPAEGRADHGHRAA